MLIVFGVIVIVLIVIGVVRRSVFDSVKQSIHVRQLTMHI